MESTSGSFQTKLGWSTFKNFWALKEIKQDNPKKFSSKPKFLELLFWLFFVTSYPPWEFQTEMWKREGRVGWEMPGTRFLSWRQSHLTLTQRKVLPITSDLSGVPLFLFPFHCQPKPLISCEMCHVSHLFLWGLCVCFIMEHSQNLDKSSTSRFQVKSPRIWGLFLGLAFSWTLKRIKWVDVITATSKNLPSVYKFYYPASPQLQYWLKLRRTKSIFLTLQTSHSSEITCGWPLKFAQNKHKVNNCTNHRI